MFENFPELKTFQYVLENYSDEIEEVRYIYANEYPLNTFMHMFLISQVLFFRKMEQNTNTEKALGYFLEKREVSKMMKLYKKHRLLDEHNNLNCYAQEFDLFCNMFSLRLL